MRLPSLAAAAAFLLAVPSVSAAAPLKVVVFDFEMINTSLEPTSTAEQGRMQALDARLRDAIAGSNKFALVDLPADARAKLATGPAISKCNGCELDAALAAGAEYALTGTVQKVSNLILNINLYLKDDRTGELQFVRSVDIRGNTDESWRHGLDYLLRNYLLADRAP